MGYKVKELRQKLSLSQEELSQRSGVSRQTISSIENNDARAATTKTLAKIARALNTTVGALFFDESV